MAILTKEPEDADTLKDSDEIWCMPFRASALGRLHDAGYKTIGDLRRAGDKDLLAIEQVGIKSVQRMRAVLAGDAKPHEHRRPLKSTSLWHVCRDVAKLVEVEGRDVWDHRNNIGNEILYAAYEQDPDAIDAVFQFFRDRELNIGIRADHIGMAMWLVRKIGDPKQARKVVDHVCTMIETEIKDQSET